MKTHPLFAVAIAAATQQTLAHGESSAENSLYHVVASPDHVMMIALVVVAGVLILGRSALRAIRQKKD